MVLVVLLVNVLMVPIGRIGPNGTFPGGANRGKKTMKPRANSLMVPIGSRWSFSYCSHVFLMVFFPIGFSDIFQKLG